MIDEFMKKLLILGISIALMSGCCIYKKYDPQPVDTSRILGQTQEVMNADTTHNMGTLPWQEMFTDPILQNLVDSVLVRNVDMRSAHLDVQKMEASLKASKLAFLPSFSLDPYAQWNMVGQNQAWMYNVCVSADWQIDLFGKQLNTKRKTQALTEQARDIEQATRVELISATVLAYYQLLLLDREQAILMQTDSLWRLGLETQKALMDAGQCYSTAVNQFEASIYDIHLQLLDVANQLNAQQNAICLLLHDAPHTIERGRIQDFTEPQQVSIGLPSALLQHRPDVRSAGRNLEAAYYGTCGAYAAMFPNVTISASIGLSGFNPLELAASAVGSLLQPIFAQGALQANLKIAKASQEQARLAYEQAVLKAGVEVNEALKNCVIAKSKREKYNAQVKALSDAYMGTHELMDQGKANYLEVLTAQQTLLSAQLAQAINDYNGIYSLVTLYVALGGGESSAQ